VNAKTKKALFGIGLAGGVGAVLLYLSTRKKASDSTNEGNTSNTKTLASLTPTLPSLTPQKESFGYLTSVSFNKTTFSVSASTGGVIIPLPLSTYFSDGANAEYLLKNVPQMSTSIGTSNPYRAHWIAWDGSNFLYFSIDNN